MTSKILFLALTILLTYAALARPSAQEGRRAETGLSVSQVRSLLSALPPLPGTIQAIRFLRRDRFWIDRAAILTQGEHSGWQIFVLHLGSSGRFSVEWKSGELQDSFAVSSANQFQTRTVGGSEEAVEFSGCAAHNCPDVFSVMLYVPSNRTAFTATYILGKVSYSPGLELGENREYKDAVDQLVKDRANR